MGHLEYHPNVSVIIPTYNRRDSVQRALDSLSRQTYPKDRFEVIIVDDGSTDGTAGSAFGACPFRVRYYRQENAGATQARNTGALESSEDVLVFMDDDMVAAPEMLDYLIRELLAHERAIVLATFIPAPGDTVNPFATLYSTGAVFPADVDLPQPLASRHPMSEMDGCWMHFTKCKTGVLAIRHDDFLSIGMFMDPTGGWPNWDDVDFGYRAHLKEFRIWRSYRAIAYHHDYALGSLEHSCARHERAARSVVRLFSRYPALAQHIPAYHDKGPISLSTDSCGLVARKLIRSLISSAPSVLVMHRLVHWLERSHSTSRVLAVLYRWLLSAHILQGYRQGLRELTERGK